MKKGQLIHTDNLILRIIVTFLGTFGAASIIETITYPLADTNLSILKNNKAKAVRFSTLESICKALDCQPGDILIYEDEEDNDE